MGVAVSLVLPAYNEAERLPPYLAAVRRYFASRTAGDGEVIVIDDGSSDDLPRAVAPVVAGWSQFRMVRHVHNHGKGAAVRTGMLAAVGEAVLFADADGATPIEEEAKLRHALADGADIAVGSRLVGSAGGRAWHRGLCGRAFAAAVGVVFDLPVRDSQCGFKMFRREVGRRVFGPCRETGYLFDLDVLLRGRDLGFRIAEVPVRWTEVPGSKVRMVRDGWKMALGLRRLHRAARAAGPAPAVEAVVLPTA